MPETKFNLLTEPWISVRRSDGSEATHTLPEVLEALGRDGVAAFPALQVHQSHAWHAFLVQLAAIALHQGRLEAGPQDAQAWARLLRALTGGRDAPWCLVVEELSQPAFLQPPVPEASLEGFKNTEQTPDAIDLLATSRNHDVKAKRIGSGTPEHWIFALVSLQTMQGYSGPKLYGIARMNGAHANRPCFAYAPGTGWGVRFTRDLAVLLKGREGIASKHGYPPQGGKALLWIEPWDGKQSLSLEVCDPFFIEVCRRVRLSCLQNTLFAHTASTECSRIRAKELHGVTGDPWAPVNRTGNKALTVGEGGFSYRLMQELLFPSDYEHGVAGQLTPQDSICIAATLVRGECVTAGWHERVIPVPPPARRLLGSPTGRNKLAAMAKHRVAIAGNFRNHVLKPALCALLQEGPAKLKIKDARVEPWLQAFDRAVDSAYFPALWRDLELPPEEADRAWEREALALAEKELGRATRSSPLSAARRYRAIAAGERFFRASARKHFPELFHREAEGAA